VIHALEPNMINVLNGMEEFWELY